MGPWFIPDAATWLPILGVFLIFFCLLAVGCWYLLDDNQRYLQRLRHRLHSLKREKQRNGKESLLQAKDLSVKSFLTRVSQKLRLLESLQTLMTQAHLNLGVEAFLLLMILLGVGGGILGFSKGGIPGGIAGAALGLFLPYKLLQLKKRLRFKRFEKQLPDALDLMARGLRAGHAITTGFQLVATEMGDPIGPEFFQTFREYNHGLDLNTALDNLRRRIPLRDLSFFTIAVMIQRETGGNLSEILEKISSLIRERFKLHNQIKALTGEGRFSGLILTILPPFTALILYVSAPSHIMLLVTDPLGKTMAITAIFLQLLGILIIRKIVNIKM